MEELPLDTGAESQTPARTWMLALLQSLRVVSWGLFVYTTPGMLLLVLLVSLWMAPAVVILLALLALQVPLFLFFSSMKTWALPSQPQFFHGRTAQNEDALERYSYNQSHIMPTSVTMSARRAQGVAPPSSKR